jgi:hypothetical protein
MEGGLCRSGGTSPATKLAATAIGWKPRGCWQIGLGQGGGLRLLSHSSVWAGQGSNPAANRRVSASGDRTRSHVSHVLHL